MTYRRWPQRTSINGMEPFFALCLMVDEERMELMPWLGFTLCFLPCFVTVRWQEGHPACKKPRPFIPRGFLIIEMESEKWKELANCTRKMAMKQRSVVVLVYRQTASLISECCKRQLNQVSLVLLYFRLSAFSDLYWVCLSVFSCSVLFVSISQVIGCEDRLRNDLYCVGWGVKLYSNQTLDIRECFCSSSTVVCWGSV